MKKADGSAAGSSQKSSAKKQRFGLPQGELHSLSYIIARAGRIVKKESQIRKAGRKKDRPMRTGPFDGVLPRHTWISLVSETWHSQHLTR